jgi:hypothetical protein
VQFATAPAFFVDQGGEGGEGERERGREGERERGREGVNKRIIILPAEQPLLFSFTH